MEAQTLPSESLLDATTAKTQFAETGNRKIAYRSIGEGKPFLLCNRFRGNLDDWDPAFLNGLAAHYRVITFDWSGFGLSTGEPATTILAFAQDVKDLAEVLGFKKIILGGWSFGGMAVQTVVTQYPKLVSQAILIGTNPPGNNDHGFEPIFWEVSRKPHNDLEDEIILFFEPASTASRKAAKASHKRIAQRTADLDIRIPENLWENYGKAVVDYVEDSYGSRTALANTSIPILVVSGDHEICFPPQNWFALVRTFPTMQLIVLPQSGHGVQHQYPELVVKYIRNFIKHTK